MTTPLASNMIPPEASASEISRSDFQSRLAGLGKVGNPELKEKKLREACEGFESIFIQKMWEEMRKTLPKSTLLHGREEQFWQGMYDQELAKKLTSAGGIGLADMMYAQLSTNLGNASRATATDAAGAAPRSFVPDVVSMLPEPSSTPAETDTVVADSPVVPDTQESGGKLRGKADAAESKISDQQPQLRQYSENVMTPGQTASRIDSIYEGEAPMDSQTSHAVLSHASGLSTDNAANVASSSAARQRSHAGEINNSRDVMNSGLTQARMAQFEAGSKLGPGAVRPSMRQLAGFGQTSEGRNAAIVQPTSANIPPLTAASAESSSQENSGKIVDTTVQSAPLTPPRMQLGNDVELSPQLRDMAETAVQMSSAIPGGGAPRPSRVRYTTNIPPSSGRKPQKDLIRTLNADAAGPNSRAGAGIAAYHAQQANKAAEQSVNIQPLSPSQTPLLRSAGAAAQENTSMGESASMSSAALYDGPASQGVEIPASQNVRQVSVRQNRRDKAGAMGNSTGIPPLTRKDKS